MRTPKLCLKYDSTRNFHHQINNIIMPDNNNSDNFSIQLLFVDRFWRRPTASKNPVIDVLLFLLVAVIHIYSGSITSFALYLRKIYNHLRQQLKL